MHAAPLDIRAVGLGPAWTGLELWLVDLDAPTSAVDGPDSLHDDEQARAARFVFERDRRRYRAGRQALRSILARRLGVGARDIRLGYGPYGKPFVQWPAGPLHFNLSHSQHLALLALSDRGPLGVDIEAQRPMKELRDLAEHHFTAREIDQVFAGPAPALEGFFRVWTRKEACLKAWGAGLNWPTRLFEVGADRGSRDVAAPAGHAGEPLKVESLSLADNAGFEAAVSLGHPAGPR